MLKKTLTLFFIFSITTAQTFNLVFKVKDFQSATSFSVNQSENIYITDAGTNEVSKINANGEVINNAGGFGWDPESFDNPSDIFANSLNVYVTDENNHRIQIFDKDLNFISLFDGKNIDNEKYRFAYPKSCYITNQGDMFIIDGDNQRVLKYDLTGRFVMQIGDIDAGAFSLTNPNALTVSNGGKIFIADDSSLVVYDLFGNGLAKIKSGLSKTAVSITDDILTICSPSTIKYLRLNSANTTFTTVSNPISDEMLVKAAYTDKYLYVLTRTAFYKFSIN